MKKANLPLVKKFLQAAFVAGAFIAGAAQATTVQWTGPTDFDTAAMTFSPIQASQLTFVDGGEYGGYYSQYHSHGGLSTSELNLDLNGVWTNVYTGSVTSGQEFLLNGLTVNFASSQVTGIQWTTPNPQFSTYHNFDNVSFNLTDPNPNAVPEPTTVALLGLGLMGVVASRRKSANNKNV